MDDLLIRDNLSIPAEQLTQSVARSGGPGGQNVNKVNSKVILRWRPADGFLAPAPMARFTQMAKRYITTDGEVVIHCDESRDQTRNAERCREKLKQLILQALAAPKRRVATKPTKASKTRRLDDKRRAADKKKTRRNLGE
jgi:ribosome-associated protein